MIAAGMSQIRSAQNARRSGVSPAAWTTLSGAARFPATEPVTGGRPNVSTTRDPRQFAWRGVSASCASSVLLGWLLVVLADRVMRVTATRPAPPAMLPGWPRSGVTEQQPHPDGDGQRRRGDDDGPEHHDESTAAVSMASANARAFTPSIPARHAAGHSGPTGLVMPGIIAQAYDSAPPPSRPGGLAASERQNQRLRLLFDIGARNDPRMGWVGGEFHDMLDYHEVGAVSMFRCSRPGVALLLMIPWVRRTFL